LIWLIKDEIVKNEDSKKAEHILTTYINPEKTITSYLNTKELTGYLNHVRKLNPKMTEATKNKILRIYEQMRELSRDSQSIAIGTRQLEAIVRLSTAHAKLFFRDEVIVEDVLAVEDIIKEMYANFGVSLEVSKQFDQSKLTGVSKTESKEQKALRVWNDLADEQGHVKDIHFIKLMEKEDGITEEDARKIFARWEQNCVIKLVREHFYKRA